MENIWNDFLDYCLQHNVTELDFWILFVAEIIGIALIIWSWVYAIRVDSQCRINDDNYNGSMLCFSIPVIISIATTTSIIEIIIALCDTPFLYLSKKLK